VSERERNAVEAANADINGSAPGGESTSLLARPEVEVGAAFAGGLALAWLIRRIRS
jgi:hypothetical protein